MSTCRAPGCVRAPASRYAAFCDLHKRRSRRHGDAEQRGLTVHELKPYKTRIRARLKRNPENPTWTILSQRWERLVAYAREELARINSGVAYARPTRDALLNLVRVAEDVEPRTVVEMVAAIYLLREERPHRFVSDAAFSHQLVRRIRALTTMNAGEWWDHRLRKSRRVYKDVSPRVTRALAEMIETTFGGAGLALARIEQKAAKQAENERAVLAEAIGSLE